MVVHARGPGRVGRPAAFSDRRGIPVEGDGVPPGDGGPWPVWETLSEMRGAGPAHRLCRKRMQLLRALSDGRTPSCGSRDFAPFEAGLAALVGRNGKAHRRATAVGDGLSGPVQEFHPSTGVSQFENWDAILALLSQEGSTIETKSRSCEGWFQSSTLECLLGNHPPRDT